ncbi:MAG: arsenite methyltransferase [Flavobacteriales bacterium]|nr:arsenite methyltransferase [Flavobacteriales bacterium]MCB9174037.1 arsenite methyltransferase [Flavobacteriales bacterium]
MKNAEELKQLVKDKYSEIALQSKTENETSCCGAGGCSTVDYAVFAEDYTKLGGYNADADLGLGCGIPTEFAQIKEGDTVLDLGSGAGNDCFVARALVGEKGKVIGVDMTEIMIDKARENAGKLNFNNVEFRFGDIENLPIGGNRIDVVISNCVLNLVPDKEKAFAEMFRVLKAGGHFSVSDVVLKGDLPGNLKNDAEMYAGCVSGAIQLDDYMNIIHRAGFVEVSNQKEKLVVLPNEILSKYLSPQEIEAYNKGEFGIFSVTVYGQKPCCDPKSGCC